jgi:hypothetical protein
MHSNIKPPISQVMVWKRKEASGELSQPFDCEAVSPRKVGLARQLQLLALQHKQKAKKDEMEKISND